LFLTDYLVSLVWEEDVETIFFVKILAVAVKDIGPQSWETYFLLDIVLVLSSTPLKESCSENFLQVFIN
jgi:hypothetical protein